MSRTIFVCFLVVAFVCATYAYPSKLEISQECNANEEFVTCGSFCEPSCQNPEPKMCTFNCKIGCSCLSGFVRNSAGECVLLRNC